MHENPMLRSAADWYPPEQLIEAHICRVLFSNAKTTLMEAYGVATQAHAVNFLKTLGYNVRGFHGIQDNKHLHLIKVTF